MQEFTIRRNCVSNVYQSPLFSLTVFKTPYLKPLLIFSNGKDGAGVSIDRKEASNLLQQKFKNQPQRRIQRASFF
jgi:hypothetical protein